MGLFNFLGNLVTLPIKIAAAPVETLERVLVNESEIEKTVDEVTKTIEEAFDDLDESIEK